MPQTKLRFYNKLTRRAKSAGVFVSDGSIGKVAPPQQILRRPTVDNNNNKKESTVSDVSLERARASHSALLGVSPVSTGVKLREEVVTWGGEQ